MYRSHNCGELNTSHINQEVTLAGWVQKSRDKGFMNWVDLRDRYGITQLLFDESRSEKSVFELAKTLGREFVVQVKGTVIEREAKNKNMVTGEIEILVKEMRYDWAKESAAAKPTSGKERDKWQLKFKFQNQLSTLLGTCSLTSRYAREGEKVTQVEAKLLNNFLI